MNEMANKQCNHILHNFPPLPLSAFCLLYTKNCSQSNSCRTHHIWHYIDRTVMMYIGRNQISCNCPLLCSWTCWWMFFSPVPSHPTCKCHCNRNNRCGRNCKGGDTGRPAMAHTWHNHTGHSLGSGSLLLSWLSCHIALCNQSNSY